MLLDITFNTHELTDKLVVPKTALFTFQNQDALFVVVDNRAKVRPVTTGFETRQHIVIEQGLQENDLILLDPRLDGLDDGSRITYEMNNSTS